MTDASTAVSAAPLVADLQPYINALASVVVPVLVGIGIAYFRKITGLQIQQAAADKLDAIIEDKVGGAVATAADNLATKSIPLGSSLVASIAQEVVAEAPGVLATAGVTPASVAGMVHGQIGLWQARMTSVTPPAVNTGVVPPAMAAGAAAGAPVPAAGVTG